MCCKYYNMLFNDFCFSSFLSFSLSFLPSVFFDRARSLSRSSSSSAALVVFAVCETERVVYVAVGASM